MRFLHENAAAVIVEAHADFVGPAFRSTVLNNVAGDGAALVAAAATRAALDGRSTLNNYRMSILATLGDQHARKYEK